MSKHPTTSTRRDVMRGDMPADFHPGAVNGDSLFASLNLSRRSALKGGAAAVALSFAAEGATAQQPIPLPVAPDQALTVSATINGQPVAV